jgi:hypothetical protein
MAEADTPPHVVGTFVCVKKAQARVGFALDSEKTAVILRDEQIDGLEVRENGGGANRIRFARGWVSEKTAAGDVSRGR